MYRTLRISFSLKNTYRVNSILYAVKQIPLIKKILPDALYGVKGLKIFANVLSAAGEVLSVFLGKFLYLAIMIRGIGELYKEVPGDQVFLHILLFLTVIGAYMNTSLFEPTRDKLRIYNPESDFRFFAFFHLFRNSSGHSFLVLPADPLFHSRSQTGSIGTFS